MRKLLLVEDDVMLRDVYAEMIALEPYLLDVAVNGREALQKCETTKYDLILLDLMMPVLDGVGFMREFSSHPEFDQTKVIIMSNLSSGKEINQALDLGARANYVKAELTPRQFIATLRYELEAA